MGSPMPLSSGDPLRSLLRVSHQLPVDRFGVTITEHGRLLGAHETVVYLADYNQHVLIPLQGEGVPAREEITIDGSVGGLAFRRVRVTPAPAPAGMARVWIPLLDGAERLGVLELLVDEDLPAGLDDEAAAFAALVAELMVGRDAYSDLFSRLRRRRPLSLAAEIQWELLPPLTYASDRVVISGALEPAYEIGGDTFDYAINGPVVDLLALDAVGHGLSAALLASAALGAYRHGRREQLELPDVSMLMNEVIVAQFTGSQFATAALARLNLDTGLLSWVNAGHPDPVIVRDGVIAPLSPCPPARPLGLQTGPPDVCQMQLRPGDRVLLYTDGIVEARSPDGEFFGESRLADFVVRAEAAGDPPPETLRRLMRSVMDHQDGQLQDDASIVLLEWRTGREDQLTV